MRLFLEFSEFTNTSCQTVKLVSLKQVRETLGHPIGRNPVKYFLFFFSTTQFETWSRARSWHNPPDLVSWFIRSSSGRDQVQFDVPDSFATLLACLLGDRCWFTFLCKVKNNIIIGITVLILIGFLESILACWEEFKTKKYFGANLVDLLVRFGFEF